MPRIVEPTPQTIEAAAATLRAGGVVAFPTETVYGLGADTFSPRGLDRVYELKQRPADNPLIAHVLGPPGAQRLTSGWDTRCEVLTQRFWPGPLTLVLPRALSVPARATAGRPSVAIRCPRHPIARDLIDALGDPISAPSANRSGHVSATSAGDVADEFADVERLMVLDGGPCAVGLESTVLDLTRPEPRILRPGSVTRMELLALLGPVRAEPVERQEASPGTSSRHYAPNTPAELVTAEQLAARLRDASEPAVVLCFDRRQVPPPHTAIEMPQGAGDYAKQLYASLRRADAMKRVVILIEQPPGSNDVWLAILDRLRRATA
ncbi:MAG: threonylcarbamoyl-AMP synthase [Phycisphaerales bacterium]|nr:threonylcarbamoyl-AMP synthase [Phycisphaerales bacterium]NNM25832.1 threonylcarbamoyl-AMP synthase [Phycisphaerales bacterium]